MPNPVDPRGFFTFGVAGLALLVLGWLVAGVPGFPRYVAKLAGVTGVLLLVVYAARLADLDAENPLLLVPAVLVGFVASPALYVSLGRVLIRR